jgi:hypothetical protein
MAKLSTETMQILWRLKGQLLNLVDEAKALELNLFAQFGEADEVLIVLDELKEREFDGKKGAIRKAEP